jgi:hypothetical protein
MDHSLIKVELWSIWKRVAVSLYEHKSVKSALTQNLLNISKSVKIWKMLQ